MDFHGSLKVGGLAGATSIEVVFSVGLFWKRIVTLKLRLCKTLINLKLHLNSGDGRHFTSACGFVPFKVRNELQFCNLVEKVQRRRHKRLNFIAIVFGILLL